jgi:hypothetical protein
MVILPNRVVAMQYAGGEVLGGVVDEHDHSPRAAEPPQDELGISIQSTVVEDELVDVTAAYRICGAIKWRKEPKLLEAQGDV